MRSLKNDKGNAIMVVFFANLFMLGVLCMLAVINQDMNDGLSSAGQAIEHRHASIN